MPENDIRKAVLAYSGGFERGVVRLKLYRGSVRVVGRRSETDSLFDEGIATFEDDAGAFRQADAKGFIRLNALRIRVAARKGRQS